MKSAGNRGVVQSSLQMLHIHVLLVAPLSSRHMTQPRTDQHQSRVPVRERPHHTRPAANLSVQPFDHIVGADASPMLTWEVAVGQCFFNTVLTDRRWRDLTAPQSFSDVFSYPFFFLRNLLYLIVLFRNGESA